MKLIDKSKTPDLIKPAGQVHEATVKHEGCYLVFSTHDCPFEEELSIQLFGAEGQELERVNLYEQYAGGLFTLKEVSNSCVEFTFWSEDRLRLTSATNQSAYYFPLQECITPSDLPAVMWSSKAPSLRNNSVLKESYYEHADCSPAPNHHR